MTLCTCTERPMCEQVCSAPADWSVWMKPWGKRGESFKFMCDGHFQEYREAWAKPMRGVDKPKDAPEDWRSTILDHINLVAMDLAYEQRTRRRARR